MSRAIEFKSGWLVCQAQVLSSLNIAETVASRRRGLIGQTEIDTPLLIDSCKWIHTFGVKCPLDVAYLDAKMQVIKISKMKPLRIGSWNKAKDLGKIRVEGKDYEVVDGDTLEIRHNT